MKTKNTPALETEREPTVAEEAEAAQAAKDNAVPIQALQLGVAPGTSEVLPDGTRVEHL